MEDSQKQYFLRRAHDEREAADHASDQRAAQSHREMARRYDEKVNDEAEAADSDESSGILPNDFTILP